MPSLRRPVTITALTLAILPFFVSPSFPQHHEGRPAFGREAHERAVERGEDDRRAEDRDTDDQKAAGEDRAAGDKVTAADLAEAREKVSKRESIEAPDLKALKADIEADAKTKQAEHAWERRGDTEFKKIGINDASELQAHAEDVRSNSDIQKDLSGDRTAYAKFHDADLKKGTIVIDNKKADNGGTIMTNHDIEERIRDLK